MDGNALGTAIKIVIDALTPEQKTDLELVWQTICTEITTQHNLDIDNLNATQIPYDNTSSGLTATNVQDAVDEIAGLLP